MSPNDSETAAPVGESRQPNPEAIAWYVEEAQRLLEDQQRQVESLRIRGGQVAGFGAAVLALIGGNAGELISALEGPAQTVVDVALITSVSCLATAVVIAIWGALRPKAFTAIAAGEIAAYAGERFLGEPDLWRVQVRSLHALDRATAGAQTVADSTTKAIEWSLRAFLAGFAFSLLAVATLLAGAI